MARIRSIKPDFFTDDRLAECSFAARLFAIAILTVADREGLLEDRPRKLKAQLLPYDEVDVNALLGELEKIGYLIRYEVDGERYISIPGFKRHQQPHIKESASTLPAPCSSSASTLPAHQIQIQEQEGNGIQEQEQVHPAHASAPTPAREDAAENPTTTTGLPASPIAPESPESPPGESPPLPPPSARPPQESPPRSAPPPPSAGPLPGHLRQQPRGPAWDPTLVSAEDGDRLREASLRRLLDPAAWLVSVAAYLRDKSEPHALARWESLVHADRIAEAVAALEITGQQPRGAWDAYAKRLLLDAMTGGRSLAQERAAPARASPPPDTPPSEDFADRWLRQHMARAGQHPPNDGPVIDVQAEEGEPP